MYGSVVYNYVFAVPETLYSSNYLSYIVDGRYESSEKIEFKKDQTVLFDSDIYEVKEIAEFVSIRNDTVRMSTILYCHKKTVLNLEEDIILNGKI